MIHGLPNKHMIKTFIINNDWTEGCVAVKNNEMDFLWKIVDIGPCFYKKINLQTFHYFFKY